MAAETAPPAPQRRVLAPNVQGALWMVGSAVCYTSMAALIKHTGGEHFSPFLQAFYRQLAGLILMSPVILRMGRAAFHTPRKMLMLARSLTNSGGLILTFYGFQKMPLVTANALGFTRALWVALLAAVVLREKVGPLRIAAVVVGFGGILLMLGPALAGRMEMGLPALAMLGSAVLGALGILGIKAAAKDTTPAALMTWSAVSGVLLLLPGALVAWRWPGPMDLALLSATGALGLGSQGCYIKAMHIGDAGAMAPMDYVRLLFSALIGFTFFGEVPTLWTVAGAVVIVASTLFVTLREQQLARRARQRTSEVELEAEAAEI